MVTSYQFPLWVKDNICIVVVATVTGAFGITGVTGLLVPHIRNHIDGVTSGHAAESFLHWCWTKSVAFLVKEKKIF